MTYKYAGILYKPVQINNSIDSITKKFLFQPDPPPRNGHKGNTHRQAAVNWHTAENHGSKQNVFNRMGRLVLVHNTSKCELSADREEWVWVIYNTALVYCAAEILTIYHSGIMTIDTWPSSQTQDTWWWISYSIKWITSCLLTLMQFPTLSG